MVQVSRSPLLARWAVAREGSVAIIFAAIIIPVIGITAAAIDFGRAANVRSSLQMAASAAAQAASAHLGEDRSVVERQAKAMLAANLPTDLKNLPYRLIIANDRSFVEVGVETRVPTSLMGVLGVADIAVEATGFARPTVMAVAEPAVGGEVRGAAQRGPTDQAVGQMFDAAGVNRDQPARVIGRPRVDNSDELRAVAREIDAQLRDLRTKFENGSATISVPPEARAEIERMMRELRRNAR